MAKALGTGAIPSELSTIIAVQFLVFQKDGTALTLYKRLGRGINSFLEHLSPGVDHIPGLDWVTLVGVDPDRTVHLLK